MRRRGAAALTAGSRKSARRRRPRSGSSRYMAAAPRPNAPSYTVDRLIGEPPREVQRIDDRRALGRRRPGRHHRRTGQRGDLARPERAPRLAHRAGVDHRPCRHRPRRARRGRDAGPRADVVQPAGGRRRPRCRNRSRWRSEAGVRRRPRAPQVAARGRSYDGSRPHRDAARRGELDARPLSRSPGRAAAA